MEEIIGEKSSNNKKKRREKRQGKRKLRKKVENNFTNHEQIALILRDKNGARRITVERLKANNGGNRQGVKELKFKHRPMHRIIRLN